VVGHYKSFFSASAGASAAILGCCSSSRVSVVNADTRTHNSGVATLCWPGARLSSWWNIFFVSIVALTGGCSRLRAIEHRQVATGRPAGHKTSDTESKAGWQLLLPLSKQRAEYRLRVNFGCGLFSATRPRRSAPREHPECRIATCFVSSLWLFWQRSCPGHGGVTGITRRG